jgi:hypothetical protein
VTDQPLVARVSAVLRARGIPFALVGAGALAARGVARSTFDLDLFTTVPAPLDAHFWADLSATPGIRVVARSGDAEDPLLGVVRIEADGERTVDVVVGRHAWQADVVARATPVALAGVLLPVATASDLVLLKLYAGGSQDRWDIEQLLAGEDRASVVAEVDARVAALASEARRLWASLAHADRT